MRHIPEAGAVCGNSARTDLCGGQGVTFVPTATFAKADATLTPAARELTDEDVVRMVKESR